MGFPKMGLAFSYFACVNFCEHPNFWRVFFGHFALWKNLSKLWMLTKNAMGNVWKRQTHFWKAKTFLYKLPIERNFTSTKYFKIIGVKSWVSVLKTLGVVLFPCASLLPKNIVVGMNCLDIFSIILWQFVGICVSVKYWASSI